MAIAATGCRIDGRGAPVNARLPAPASLGSISEHRQQIGASHVLVLLGMPRTTRTDPNRKTLEDFHRIGRCQNPESAIERADPKFAANACARIESPRSNASVSAPM
jgi:hypothetical protein